MRQWIKRGYIYDAIWKGLGDYIDNDLLTPEKLEFFLSNEVKRNKEREKLSREEEGVPDYLLCVISRYVDSSKHRDFALKHVGLQDAELEMIEEDHTEARRRNFEVTMTRLLSFLFKFTGFLC